MNSDDRDVGAGGQEVVAEDNVVRLPREWLGPPEDLVPIAETPADGETATTLDFWGTTVASAPAAPGPGSDDHSVRRHPARSLARTRAGHGSRRVSGTDGRPPDLGPHVDGRRPRRVPGVAVVALAVTLILIALSLSPGDRPTHSSAARLAARSPQRTDQASALRTASVLSPGRELTLLRVKRAPRSRRHAPATRRHPSRSVRARARARHHGRARLATRHAAPPAATQGAAVRPTVSSPTTPTATTTQTNPTYSTPVTTYAAHPAANPSGTSAGSSQPATGASGALSPGTSPDG